jgi:adenosylmethionine-8-amino-7-oxononanoate aminotransferase
VADKSTKQPFPRAERFAERVAAAAFDDGLLVIAGTGCVNGRDGDTITLAPPFVLTDQEVEEIVTKLTAAIDRTAADGAAR